MSLLELKSLISLCRKNGIVSITYEGISMTFGEQPQKPKTSKKTSTKADAKSEPFSFESNTLTEQELLFWSSDLTGDAIKGVTSEG